MTHKGQIVEIPDNALFYKRVIPEFLSKEEELRWKSEERKYSLFDGFLVGEHLGIENFRIGQRKGIKVGGKKQPLYVIQIDEANQRLFVGAGENHPGLWTNVWSFSKKPLHFNQEFLFSPNELENGVAVEIESSVVEGKVPAKLYVFAEHMFLEFEQPTLIIIKENPARVFYNNKELTELKK